MNRNKKQSICKKNLYLFYNKRIKDVIPNILSKNWKSCKLI